MRGSRARRAQSCRDGRVARHVGSPGRGTEPRRLIPRSVSGLAAYRRAELWRARGGVPVITAFFLGLKAAVLAIVLHAVQRVGSRALKSRPMLVLAASAFIGIFFFNVPFPLIVIGAGIIGFVAAQAGSTAFQVGGAHGGEPASTDEGMLGADLPEHARPSLGRALRISALWLALWLLPVSVIGYSLGGSGGSDVFTQIGLFFSKMAVVTFGGAYAVLAYMAQQAVETYGWLKPGEMLDGLGMAETTPGPLIMVVQFVGFLAAFRDPGALSPMLAGFLGGLLASWCTFVPCFLWIGLGAPFIEKLRDNKSLSGGLAGITAAVVGVILNLAIWFALHTWFREVRHVGGLVFSFEVPIVGAFAPWAILLSMAAMVAIFRFKAGMIPTLLACSAAGALLHFAGVV
jgi:chromate transporter